MHGAEQVPWALCGSHRLLRETHAASVFETSQQLHASQAIKTEFLFKGTVECHRHGALAVRV
jgi:hypothetical protein